MWSRNINFSRSIWPLAWYPPFHLTQVETAKFMECSDKHELATVCCWFPPTSPHFHFSLLFGNEIYLQCATWRHRATFVSFGVLLQVAYWHTPPAEPISLSANNRSYFTVCYSLYCVLLTGIWQIEEGERWHLIWQGRIRWLMEKMHWCWGAVDEDSFRSCNKWGKVSYRTCLLRDNLLIYFVALSLET